LLSPDAFYEEKLKTFMRKNGIEGEHHTLYGGESETSLVKIRHSEIIKGNGGEVLRIRK